MRFSTVLAAAVSFTSAIAAPVASAKRDLSVSAVLDLVSGLKSTVESDLKAVSK